MAKEKKPAKPSYFEAVGRRKTSVARVRIFSKGEAGIIVNEKNFEKYFPTNELRNIVEEPLKKMKLSNKFKILIRASGGGIHSQAEATRHGITRALVIFDADFRKRLKKAGFLKRDPRMKERRKFGLKKARKAPQWSKR
ncbi:30S ribosomal protein S9 [Patescibacteria group bacterium]|nr:30S ribosomal protein S9 [Patescibacteria group bacterium]MBU2263698.1 30S ribosomal protein S9 [Patescibacteria group bacterium]